MPSAIATPRLPSRRSTALLAALALLPWPVRAAGEPPDAPPPQSQTETQETPAQALPEPVQEIIVTGRTDFGEIPYQMKSGAVEIALAGQFYKILFVFRCLIEQYQHNVAKGGA